MWRKPQLWSRWWGVSSFPVSWSHPEQILEVLRSGHKPQSPQERWLTVRHCTLRGKANKCHSGNGGRMSSGWQTPGSPAPCGGKGQGWRWLQCFQHHKDIRAEGKDAHSLPWPGALQRWAKSSQDQHLLSPNAKALTGKLHYSMNVLHCRCCSWEGSWAVEVLQQNSPSSFRFYSASSLCAMGQKWWTSLKSCLFGVLSLAPSLSHAWHGTGRVLPRMAGLNSLLVSGRSVWPN